MTQEDKELLLKDLCARLPYNVKLSCGIGMHPYTMTIESRPMAIIKEGFKPYLRPMSSMTEEEYNSIDWDGCSHTIYYDKDGFHFGIINSFTTSVLDYLNVRHFDYHNLLEKGLALEAKEGIYKTE